MTCEGSDAPSLRVKMRSSSPSAKCTHRACEHGRDATFRFRSIRMVSEKCLDKALFWLVYSEFMEVLSEKVFGEHVDFGSFFRVLVLIVPSSGNL